MQSSNSKQETRSKDLIWYLLGEYSLRELLPDPEKRDKIAAGMLSQMVRELAIPIECVENNEMALRNFAREALVHLKQGRVELPERIRIFCQKKMIDEERKGGWGYFVIERSRDASSSDSQQSYHFIELYLYEEGK